MINKHTGKTKIVILIALLGVVLAGLTASTTAKQELSKIIFYVG
jgi:hypothetical protein